MNRNIAELEPEVLWRHFAEICAIPHPSRHEEAIREYVVKFAEGRGFDHTVDAAGNIMIRKPATRGMEGRKGVILQSHLDMVPQKNGGKRFDFEKDPIEARSEGGWVTADGTTLGADNGIGVAATLAVLESAALTHGPLEALFTASEEVGDGAFGLQPGELRGDILMNLDSETEGELCVGCAGGLDANAVLSYEEERSGFSGYKAVSIEVRGLRGGHSGLEIILQRANANKVLCRFLLRSMERYGLRLASIDGGGLRNAIPREAVAVVLVNETDMKKLKEDTAAFENLMIAEYAGIEDSISVKCVDTGKPASVIGDATAMNLIKAVCACQNGVIAMSLSMPGLVQTSSNLARVVSENGEIVVQCLLRSSVNSEKENLGQDISAVFGLAGADVELSGSYDGWNPNMDSPILKTMKAGYKELYGREPGVVTVHAGLECGIIGGTYPNLDMISFGPTIKYPHSPDEKVNIGSVAKFWRFLCHTLATVPAK